jgi:hypothetical protein
MKRKMTPGDIANFGPKGARLAQSASELTPEKEIAGGRGWTAGGLHSHLCLWSPRRMSSSGGFEWDRSPRVFQKSRISYRKGSDRPLPRGV